MPRATRCFIPGEKYVWHITHRCHKKEYLLKFKADKIVYLRWLYRAKRKFGICLLNYTITSNHVHLLVVDQGRPETISKSVHLAAGRTAQEFNARKERSGSFWEDRYHASVIEDGKHLLRCLIYIDLNMVRAGVVTHPRDWPYGGFAEIQIPRKKMGLIDHAELMKKMGANSHQELKEIYLELLNERMRKGNLRREPWWTENVAVGNKEFLMEIKEKLGVRGIGKKIREDVCQSELRENQNIYQRIILPKKDRYWSKKKRKIFNIYNKFINLGWPVP